MNVEPTPTGFWQTRHQLEQSWQQQQRGQPQGLGWQAWFQRAIAQLTPTPGPRVTEVMTPQGRRWKVEDPQGHRTYWFDQATEVRAWLEQRYYLD